MKTRFLILFSLSALLCTPTVFTQEEPDPGALFKDMEARFHNADSLQFEFRESYFSQGGGLGHPAEEGVVFLVKPKFIRWEYKIPEEKLFLSDGRFVYFYIPNDQVVYRGPFKESIKRQPLMRFLLQGRKLESAFTFELVEKKDNQFTFRGTPKRESREGNKFLITLDESGTLVKLAFFDEMNNLVMFEMKNIKFDPDLDSGMFQFEIPEHADIIDGADFP